jgi:cytolysin (calcineurin-like family phosphatase)
VIIALENGAWLRNELKASITTRKECNLHTKKKKQQQTRQQLDPKYSFLFNINGKTMHQRLYIVYPLKLNHQ